MRVGLETEEGEKKVTREARSGKTCLENALHAPKRDTGDNISDKIKKSSYIVFFLKRNIKCKILNQIEKKAMQRVSYLRCSLWTMLL